MKELKPITRKRFKCDFCNKVTARKSTMERHEKICYYNPNRVCEWCDNVGYWGNGHDEPKIECEYCKIFKNVQANLSQTKGEVSDESNLSSDNKESELI